MKKTTIYGLYSTRDNVIRYVGKSNNPKSRLKDHVYTSKTNLSNTYKSCWIRKELNDGYKINYEILETCNLDEWPSKEMEYISKYENLTNHHKGGLGGSPLTYNQTYSELKEWAENNLPKEIDTREKWKEYIKLNYKGIVPINPNKVYKNYGWTSWADFLNTDFYHNVSYVSYDEFKTWVINNVKNYQEFKKIKKPYGITSHPERTYKDVWIGWIGIFNDAMIRNRNLYWDYDTCKKYLNDNYGNMTRKKFSDLCKNNELPYQIPKKPARIFINFDYKEFLNLEVIQYLPFEDAREIVRKMGIKTNKEWRVFCKSDQIPKNIPTSPDSFYRKVWINWYDWLGNKKK